MRTPPCSDPPLAGAHVGRAAVVMAHAVQQQSPLARKFWQPFAFVFVTHRTKQPPAN